jgi:hypothetical protein
MKRISLLLIVVALCMLFGSSSAFACARCGIDHNNPDCAICRYGVLFGGDDCQFSPPDCSFCEQVGTCGGGLASAAHLPLATQFTVASVERLDEQRTITATGPVKHAQLAPSPTPTR